MNVQAEPTAIQAATPAQLLAIAVNQGADLDRLERLMQLQERWEANEARKAYLSAIAEFKRKPPTILKEKQVNFQTSRGTTSYRHATLGNVTEPVIQGLAAVGISHRWNIDQTDSQITVSCILTHQLGHSESVTMKAGRDDSGGKNSIQQVASTVTYLQRYTLLSITGLATHDMDDDGQAADAPPAQRPPPTLDAVLLAYGRVTTPGDMSETDAMAARLVNAADKEMARRTRAEKLKELKKPKPAPAEPGTDA